MKHFEYRLRTARAGAVWLGLLVALAGAAGCAPRAIRLGPEDLAALNRAATVTLARHQPPAFAVQTPGNTTVGSVSGVSGGDLVFPGRAAGSAPIESEYGLDDPAIAARKTVLDALRFEAGVTAAPTEVPAPADDRVESLIESAGRDGWVLDVRTLHWGLAADPKLWTRYRVSLRARGRLVDVASGRTAWQGFCDATESDAPIGSTMPELTARDAEPLKARLAAAGERCGRALVEQMFSGVR
ncbi:MAG: hypothetical protein ACOYXU_12300 [Nitrospirota bacterium]